jgi:hypothetical protein
MGYLGMRGIWFWRNNSGVFSPRPGSFIRAGTKGMPDLLAVLPPNGRLVGIEVKREEGGRLSPAQKAWGEELTRHGGLFIVARSVQDVIDALPPGNVRPA